MTLHLSRFTLSHWLLLGLVLIGAASLCKLQTTVAAQWSATKPPFVVRSYGGKCLEFGVPRTPIEEALMRNYPVFISGCNGSVVQQIRVEELTDRPGRLVVLRAGNRVIGKKLDPPVLTPLTAEAEGEAGVAGQTTLNVVHPASTPDQTPLEAQSYTGAPGQIFALDGDSIILAAERNLVVEVKDNRGANGTPLVLGRRELDDSEFWDFIAADGSTQRPTSGFVRVPQEGDIRTAARQFVSAVQAVQPGTVIEIAPDVSINLAGYPKLFIGTEVTIRGDRRGTRSGPELYVSEEYGGRMLTIDGHDVRITGLRLRGPSRSTVSTCWPQCGDTPLAIGIFVRDDLYTRSIIDHNELSGWPKSAVEVNGGEEARMCDENRQAGPLRRSQVRVARNFIHHNQRQGEGYGVATYDSAFPLIEGNTFVSNRHAIASDGFTHTGYRAWYNLVLSTAPKQRGPIPDKIPGLGQVDNWFTHDFDMHGTGNLEIDIGVHEWEIEGFGGTGGEYVEIARNTFLATNRPNFKLRGEPCNMVEFHNNVSRRPRTARVGQTEMNVAVQCSYCGDLSKLRVFNNNQFNAPNPTDRLGVGDFDGDGKDDLFLATGAAWYYAPAGQAEWRYLNAQTDKINTLLFGDFDADGRTDVFTQHGDNRWDVSWGGASQWEMINGSGPLLGNAAIGDFDGDGRADVFYADGREWLVSFGGTGFFLHYAFAAHRVANLRFGDFNNDGKTDVFGVVSGQWMVVYGGTEYWAPLRPKLTDSVTGLTVADFDGDGRADVARSISLVGLWQVSWGGTSDWAKLRTGSRALSSMAAIGRFDGAPGADVLTWAPRGLLGGLLGLNALDIASGGAGAFQEHSRQDMR